eukprot:TRINITY_DN35841_c0_g1_i1.p2 TRINITY_DN35841_c0_g1~~TRINITY_DN35841_c0_g1_i1.p2  ORF type:complete len:150 (+),score=44.86 TRINITY_DN35841_c0_g1_i1:96-545(+)
MSNFAAFLAFFLCAGIAPPSALVAAFRSKSDSMAYMRASYDEMVQYAESSLDELVLGASIILFVMTPLHYYTGDRRAGTYSALGGLLFAAQAAGMVDEKLCTVAVFVAVVAAAAGAGKANSKAATAKALKQKSLDVDEDEAAQADAKVD